MIWQACQVTPAHPGEVEDKEEATCEANYSSFLCFLSLFYKTENFRGSSANANNVRAFVRFYFLHFDFRIAPESVKKSSE